MKLLKDRTMVFSDVSERDGLGIEIYRDDELVIEVFRDDIKRTRTVAAFKEDISLELVEDAIAIFKKEITWDYIE